MSVIWILSGPESASRIWSGRSGFCCVCGRAMDCGFGLDFWSVKDCGGCHSVGQCFVSASASASVNENVTGSDQAFRSNEDRACRLRYLRPCPLLVLSVLELLPNS